MANLFSVLDLVHTVVQSPGRILRADLDQDHALGTRDQNDILDQDLEVLTTREGWFLKSFSEKCVVMCITANSKQVN